MRTIDDYFLSISRFLAKFRSIVKVEPENPFYRLTDVEGRVEARIHFYDGSFLDVGEMVRIEGGVPLNFHYRYHWQRPNGPALTYDDAPHHPEVETYPAHRHRYQGSLRMVEGHPRIRLSDAIEEVLRLLRE